MSAEELRTRFDEDADLYDRARPGYPDAIFDDLAAQAGIGPAARVAEIGPGTGQATRELAARGAHVVAVELGASLAARLRHTVRGLPVEVVVAAFEDWPLPSEPFDAVVAFTSWHWLPARLRTLKVFDALGPDGALATVSTSHVRGGSDSFFADVQECYERWDPSTPPGLRLPAADDVAPGLDEADTGSLFGPAFRRRYEQEICYPTRSYVDLLGTYSGHRALPADARNGLMTCIGDLIDTHYGGIVTKRYLHELRVARRAGTRPAELLDPLGQ